MFGLTASANGEDVLLSDGSVRQSAVAGDIGVEVGGVVIITADHGNAEAMWDEANDGAHTAHTSNQVPCIIVSPELKGKELKEGALEDLAPTILKLMGIGQPSEMTGKSLL